MSKYTAFIPEFVRLARIRRAFPHAEYVRSVDVNRRADLGKHVGVGKDVVVNAGVSIGDYSYINRGAIIFSGTIGKFCSIAQYVQIGPEEHPTDHISTSPHIYGARSVIGTPVDFDEFPSPPVIGNDVWIGSAAWVGQGVTIGDGAVIAASAVVTRDVAPYMIVRGVPASPLRSRFPATDVDRLLASKW